MARIEVLLADVDGTLVTQEKVLTEQASAAARELRARGVKLAVTSGRPPRGMRMLIEPLALDTAIAGFNGGVLVNPDLSVIETRTLDPKAARMAVELLRGHGLDAWLYTATEWLIRDKDAPHVEREARTVQFDAVVVPDFTEEHLAHAVKVVGVSDDHALVARAEAEAQEQLGNQASATRSQPYYLDITHPLANKGEVVRSLAKRLGIPQDAIATIGDSPNDVLMFRESGFSVAMGNASDEVKKQASAATASNEEEGFARAVRELILPRHSA